MRDLNRKVEKFIKEKNVTSAKKTGDSPLTPHVIYGVSSGPKTFAKIKTNMNTRSFSMTVSFFNPRFEKVFPKDFAIRHEDKKTAIIASSPDRPESPMKRNPILQNNDEGVREPRSTVKFTPLSARTTIFTEEPVYSRKIAGEFNHIYNARSLSPKIEGIRTAIPKRSDSPDMPRRQKKGVKSPHMKNFNPITEGDITGVQVRKERNPPEVSDALKKINDRNVLLAAERGANTKGKVFRDVNHVLNSERAAPDSQRTLLGARLGSPKSRPQDSIRGVMEYDNALSYRDQGVTDKCNNQPISALLNTEA